MNKTRGFVIVACLGAMVTACSEDKVSTEDAYGFTIGTGKKDVFKRCQSLFEEQQVDSISATIDHDDIIRQYPWVLRDMTLEEAKPRWKYWTHWDIVGSGPPSTLIFSGGSLESVVLEDVPRAHWQPVEGVQIDKGDSYDTVLSELLRLDREGNIRAQTGWMALRSPSGFSDDQYQFLKEHDVWELSYCGPPRINLLYLHFDEKGQLNKLHRHKGAGEGL